jgi:hypothetical protein
MTTTTTTATDATQEGIEMTETDPKGAAVTDGQADPAEPAEGQQSAANQEAAKYRTKLRAAEAERDALAGTVATYQRRDAEALVGTRLLAASELWVGDATKLADLLADDGTVDPAKVDEAVTKVLADRPYLAPKRPGVPRDMGQGRRESGPAVRSMQQILRGS